MTQPKIYICHLAFDETHPVGLHGCKFPEGRFAYIVSAEGPKHAKMKLAAVLMNEAESSLKALKTAYLIGMIEVKGFGLPQKGLLFGLEYFREETEAEVGVLLPTGSDAVCQELPSEVNNEKPFADFGTFEIGS